MTAGFGELTGRIADPRPFGCGRDKRLDRNW
jgi:hypothetical protein